MKTPTLRVPDGHYEFAKIAREARAVQHAKALSMLLRSSDMQVQLNDGKSPSADVRAHGHLRARRVRSGSEMMTGGGCDPTLEAETKPSLSTESASLADVVQARDPHAAF